MKKVISLVVVMLLCLSLAVPVCAAVDSPSAPAQTGDTSMVGMWWILLVVALVAIAAVVVVYKKTATKKSF